MPQTSELIESDVVANSTAPLAEADFTTLSFENAPSSDLQTFIENERAFFFEREVLDRLVDLNRLTHYDLHDSLFPKNKVSHYGDWALRLANADSVPEDFEFDKARLRYLKNGSDPMLYLEAKGRMDGLRRDQEVDVSGEITPAVYDRLFEAAKAGDIARSRRELTIAVSPVERFGSAAEIKVHFDVPRQAGLEFSELPVDKRTWVRVEVETSSPALLDAVLSKPERFGLEFLKSGIDLLEVPKDMRKGISWTRLAKKGFDTKFHHAVEQLEQLFPGVSIKLIEISCISQLKTVLTSLGPELF